MNAYDRAPEADAAVAEPGRREDRRLLRGRGRFLDAVAAGRSCLHAHFVRSPHAHARIVATDLDAARAAPGVLFVAAAEDLDPLVEPVVVQAEAAGWHRPLRRRTLARGTARFHGDPVAVVIAADRYLAEDAGELIAIEWEALPAVPSVAAALAEGAPRVDPALPDNLACVDRYESGPVAEAFARAAHVVRRCFVQHRQTHAPMETRGLLAEWDAGAERLTVTTGTQVPHPLRTALARQLRLREDQVAVRAPDVGGAFGQKLTLGREELTVCALAVHHGLRVLWREDRMENLTAAAHAREETVDAALALDADGRILGMRLGIESDLGAYAFFPGNYVALMIGLVVPGGYRIPAYAWEVRATLTNKCPIAPMRAPMAGAAWVMEGLLDAAAAETGVDRMTIRRLNLPADGEIGARSPAGYATPDLNVRVCMERALADIDHAGLPARRADAAARGRLRGFGLANVVEPTTYGSAFYRRAGIAGSGHEAALVRIEPSGAVVAMAGVMGAGQGYETAFARLVAERLGVAEKRVAIRLGDTDASPYGMGSRGARGGTAGANALAKACDAARARLLGIAAHRLRLNDADGLRLRADRIEAFADGRWRDAGLGIEDLARIAHLDPGALPPGVDPGLEFPASWDPPPLTFSNAAHACEVEIDPLTGQTEILAYVAVENCGRVLDRAIVDGQTFGAIALGIGGVLLECVVYDEAGQNLTATLADYHLPGPFELPVPRLRHLSTPASGNPLGMKGMSEGGTIGAVAALGCAVADALRPLGIEATRQPLGAEALATLIAAARGDAP